MGRYKGAKQNENNKLIKNNRKGGKKNMKKGLLAGMISLMVLLLVGIVNAADSMTIDTVTYASGTQAIYATPSIDSADNNCSYINWTTSDGTTLTYIGYNSTAIADGWNVTNVSISWDTTNLSDDSSHTITATCYNGTGGPSIATDTETYNVDNTVPICNFSARIASNVILEPDTTWSLIGTNASSATIQFGANGAINAMTETSSGDNFEYDTTLSEGTYKIITAITSDGYNTTSCSVDYVEIDSDNTLQQVAAIINTEEKKQAETKGDLGILPFALAGLVIYFVIKKRK